MSDSDLHARILLAGASGHIELEEAHAWLNVLGGVPILRAVPSKLDRAIGKDEMYQTVDNKGNVLVAGQNYMLRGGKVKVLREQHGAGNMLDVYMRVFYLNGNLEERFEVVDGKYPEGIFNGAVYKSVFEPIDQ